MVQVKPSGVGMHFQGTPLPPAAGSATGSQPMYRPLVPVLLPRRAPIPQSHARARPPARWGFRG